MKIPKEHKLIENEVYYISEGNIFFIAKYNYDNDESDIECLRGKFTFIGYGLNIHFGINSNLLFYLNKLRTYRVATYKEKRWLECCIENNKFILEKEFNILFRKDKIKILLK